MTNHNKLELIRTLFSLLEKYPERWICHRDEIFYIDGLKRIMVSIYEIIIKDGECLVDCIPIEKYGIVNQLLKEFIDKIENKKCVFELIQKRLPLHVNLNAVLDDVANWHLEKCAFVYDNLCRVKFRRIDDVHYVFWAYGKDFLITPGLSDGNVFDKVRYIKEHVLDTEVAWKELSFQDILEFLEN